MKKMAKQLLRERFQQLAGLKPLYELEKKDPTKEIRDYLTGWQEQFLSVYSMANAMYASQIDRNNERSSEFYNLGADEAIKKKGEDINPDFADDILRDPSWAKIKDKIQGTDLYTYFLSMSSKFSNVLQGIAGDEGNIMRVIDHIIDELANSDFDPQQLAKSLVSPQLQTLGSGTDQDRDTILRLMTVDNRFLTLPPSLGGEGKEFVYNLMKGGTFKSGSF